MALAACGAPRAISSAPGVAPTRQQARPTRLPDYPDELTADEKASYDSLRLRESPELLLRAALLASGVFRVDDLARYERLARARFDAIRPAVVEEREPLLRLGKLLAAMHQPGGVLRGYSIEQHYLSDLLDTGRFNCVSSAILFNVYAGWLGYPTRAALLPTHAYALVTVGGRSVEVQTTSASGLEPLNSPGAWHEFVVARGLSGTEGGQAKQGPSRTLVFHILMNRMASDPRVPELLASGASSDGDERFLRSLLAIARRMVLLAPEDRAGTEVQAALMSRLAARVVAERPDEAYDLVRVVLKLVEGSEEQARARRNVAVATAARLERAATRGDVVAIEAIRGEARALLGCDANQDCASLDSQSEGSLWNGVIARSKGSTAGAWPVVEAILRLYPRGASPVDATNVRVFLAREAERRIRDPNGDKAEAERFVVAQLGRLECRAGDDQSCGFLCSLVAASLWERDVERAFEWAGRALGYAPSDEQSRGNYGRAAANLAILLDKRAECARIDSLRAAVAAARIPTTDVEEILAQCRRR